MASSRDLSFKVSLKDEATPGLGRISSAARTEMRKVDDALGDTATAGQRMAKILGDVADDLETELKRTEQAVERLADALGPEFAPQGVERIVTDLRAAGLTFDEIEADADELAAAIKRIDDIGSKAGVATKQGFDDVDESVRRVGDSTDNTRSVVANFSGNAISSLPGVTGAFGPLNQAIGQFGEYAAEGNIAMKNLLLAAGPIAVVSVAMGGFAAAQAKAAAAAQLNADKVSDLAERMGEGATALDAYTASLVEAGKVELGLDVVGVTDITDALRGLGLTVQDFGRLAAGSEEQAASWAAAMRASGADTEAVTRVVVAAGLEHENLAAAEELAAANASFFGAAAGDATAATDDMADATDRLAGVTDDATSATQRHADALRAAFDPMFAAVTAQGQLADAQARVNELEESGEATTADLAAANQEVAEAALGFSAAQDDLRGALDSGATSIGANRAQLQTWVTQGLITQEQADSVAGSFNNVAYQANSIPAGRTVTISANTAQAVRDIQELQRIIYGVDNAAVNVQVVSGRRAKGGSVQAGGLYRVADDSDGNAELLRSGGNTYLIPGRDGEVIPGRDVSTSPAPGLDLAALAGAIEAAIRDGMFGIGRQIAVENAKVTRQLLRAG